MKSISTIILLLVGCMSIYAQEQDSLNQQASPIGGLNQLAIKYYGIEFSKEQRQRIEGVEIELIYDIDALGNPMLAEVNGLADTDTDIVDSLKNKTRTIGRFYPQIRDGIAVPSIYFVQLTFPSYQLSQHTYGYLQASAYREAELQDFEYMKESGARMDLLFGGFANQFVGKPAKHLSLGGGMKVELNYTAKNKMFYGINMSFAQNGLKKDYPIATFRKQISPVSGFIGLSVGRWFSDYNLQLDVAMAFQNVTERMGENDNGWVQLEGWSPGLIFNYPILLGKQKPMYYYGSPTLYGNYINLSLGLRYVDYSLKEASGIMAELGVSYRMGIKMISEYKLKDVYWNDK